MTDREHLDLLIRTIELVVPYVEATLGTRMKVPGHEDWIQVHAGRAGSSINQLNGLLKIAKTSGRDVETIK